MGRPFVHFDFGGTKRLDVSRGSALGLAGLALVGLPA
jgi:hypothetical protein